MKKKRIRQDLFGGSMPKILLKMKLLSFFILVSAITTIAANSYSQQAKFNISFRNITVREVLQKIEDSSEFIFLYSEKSVDVERKVDVNATNQTVDVVLDQLFNGTKNYYEIRNRQIAILERGLNELPYSMKSASEFEQQPRSISGKVTDSMGASLPGVSVVVKGTTNGNITDANGKYTITKLPANAILLFSFVGMKNQEIAVGNKTTIDVTMVEESVGIEEVVAVGYGTQKKVSLVGSITNVNSKTLESRAITNNAMALQGALPGLTIQSTSGQPGAEGTSMTIRGRNSWATDSSPLVLIDGTPGDLTQLAPDMIDNISVLKDALSAAIYGSRASNGVILVTTKRGAMNKLQISYNVLFSTQDRTVKYHTIQDPVEWMQLRNTTYQRLGMSTTPFYTEADINAFKNGTYEATDWDNYLYRTNLVQEHRLTISGGTDKVKFTTGLNYLDQPGIIKRTGQSKYTFTSNFDLKANDFISVGGGTSFTRGNRYTPGNTGYDEIWLLYTDYLTIQPTAAATFKDPDTGATKYEACRFAKEGTNWSFADLVNSGSYTNQSDIVNLQGFVTITPVKNLVWQTKAAVYYTHNYIKNWGINGSDVYAEDANQLMSKYDPNSSVLSISQPWSQTNTLYSTMTYKYGFKKHNIDAMAGYEIDHNISQTMDASRKVFATSALQELNLGSTGQQFNSGTSSEWGLQSYFGRIKYDFDGKYLLEGNIRYDQSSRFSSKLNAALFPTVGLGWVVSNENFMKKFSFISSLKFRASWGQLGNQNIGNYPYQSTYSFGYGYNFNALTTGVALSGLANEKLTWETTTNRNVGFDLNILNGLFSMSIDYYNKRTSGILRSAQVMAAVGLNAPYVNNGSMSNSGFELELGHKKKINDKFSYWVNGNLTYNHNKIVSFGADEINNNMINKKGHEYGAFYLLEKIGIYQTNDPDLAKLKVDGNTQTPGMIKYKDMNGDGNITAADRHILGHRSPVATFGINLGAQYGNFDFSAVVYGVQGWNGYYNGLGFEPFFRGTAVPAFWRDAWTPENPTNKLPQLYVLTGSGGETNRSHPSTFYLRDLGFVRLKNIQIGYSVPTSAFKSTPINSLRLYVSCDNLFSIFNDKNTLTDPETVTNPDNGTSSSQSLAIGYPQTKTFTFGLTIKF